MADATLFCAICLEPPIALARPHRAFAGASELRFGATCATANPVCAQCSARLRECPVCRAPYATTLPCKFVASFRCNRVDCELDEGEDEDPDYERHVYFSEAAGLGELARELRDRRISELWLPMLLGPFASPGKGDWSVRAERAVTALGMLESAGARFREIDLPLVMMFEASPSDLPPLEICQPVVDAACRVAADGGGVCVTPYVGNWKTPAMDRLWMGLQDRADTRMGLL